MIRRKSDAAKTTKDCDYLQAMVHEHNNQKIHEARRLDPLHDPLALCWCCCDDCSDLDWYHKPRKGVWWRVSASGELQLMGEISGGSPSSPEISTSS